AEFLRIELKRGRDRVRLIRRIHAGVEQGLGDRAIDHAGVEMTKVIVRGKPLAEGALTRSGRPVDGDDHAKSAPSRCIIGTKSGKLVAMKAMSSTLTGASEAQPITSADIAMR